MKIVQLIGVRASGKTSTAEVLIRELSEKGYLDKVMKNAKPINGLVNLIEGPEAVKDFCRKCCKDC